MVLEDDLATAGFQDPGVGKMRPCAVDRDCGEGAWCGRSWDGLDSVCRPVIPALASRQLVELFNTSLRRSWNLPRLNPDGLLGATLELRIGASTFGVGRRTRVIDERVRLVGFSDRAMPLGLTLPYGCVERLNARLGGGPRPHAAVLVLEDRSDAPAVMRAIRDRGLEVRDRGARRAASVVGLLRLAAGALAVALLSVAAVGVLHAMAMLLDARRREIAVLRAVGVARGPLRLSLMMEASVTGVAAATVGVGLALAGGLATDRLLAQRLPYLPFRPDHLVVIPTWLVIAAVAAGWAAGS